MRVHLVSASAALVLVVAGCASTAEPPQATSGVAPQSTTSTAPPGGSSTGISGTSVSGGPIAGEQPSSLRGPDFARSVYYEFDRYDVKPEYRALVESHARWLKANPAARLRIEGNTDDRGSREYNVALGQRRAESVTALLVLLGAKSEQVEAVSFGKEKPRNAGHDEAALAENRRSDFAQP